MSVAYGSVASNGTSAWMDHRLLFGKHMDPCHSVLWAQYVKVTVQVVPLLLPPCFNLFKLYLFSRMVKERRTFLVL